MYKLSLKERKLVFALGFSARAPVSQIAKKIGLSKQGAAYLLDKLQKQRVILGFYPVINIMNLNCFYCRVFFKLKNVERGDLEKMLAWLDKNVNWSLKMEGAYDLGFAWWATSFEGFKEKTNEFCDKFSDKIDFKRETVSVELVQFKDRHVFGDGKADSLVLHKTGAVSLDETDKKLLSLLAENARSTVLELASRAGCSPKTAVQKISAMEKMGVILGFRPLLNAQFLGYVFYKVFFRFAKFRKEEIARLKGFLSAKPEVSYIQTEIGSCDLDVELMLNSSQDFFQFMRAISYEFPGLVKDYDFAIIEKQSTINYLPFGF